VLASVDPSLSPAATSPPFYLLVAELPVNREP